MHMYLSTPTTAILPYGSANQPTYIGKMILRLVSKKVGGPTTRMRTNKETTVSAEEAEKQLETVIQRMWAESTLNDRQNLWRRLHAWTSSWGLPINGITASLFCMATGVAPQGQLAYAKTLSAILGKMGLDKSPLSITVSALRASGAAIPLDQQTPIPKEVLLRWASRQGKPLRLGIYIAWKTAARWGEVWKLTSDQFLVVTGEEVIIDWWTTPKGRRADPCRASRFAVIKGHLTQEIADLFRSLSPFKMLCSINTDMLDEAWENDPEMREYRAHSIKRGASTRLLELMADDEGIDGALVDRLTKHEHGTEKEPVSRSTQGYGGNPIALARLLGTGKITPLL